MAQQANVTLNSVVYAPGGTNNGVSTWTNRSGGFGSSFSSLTESVTTPKTGSVIRELFTLSLPIVADGTGPESAGQLLRTSTLQISVWIPVNSTSAERLDLYNRLVDYVASDPIKLGIKNLEPSYG
jgi:hypothetical protein